MQSTVSHRSLLEPKSLGDALTMLRDEAPLTPMAGCTDLYVALNFGTLKETRFLNLWRLADLRTIELRGGLLSIGALATHTDIIRSPLVRRFLPMLAAAAREIGGVQIQNRGTIGGNIANASPAGDTLPVLSAADAVVVLESTGGTRRVPSITSPHRSSRPCCGPRFWSSPTCTSPPAGLSGDDWEGRSREA